MGAPNPTLICMNNVASLIGMFLDGWTTGNRHTDRTKSISSAAGVMLQLLLHSEKSGAKTVPQRSHFGKRLLFGKEGPFFSFQISFLWNGSTSQRGAKIVPQRGQFCGQENGPSEEPFWLLFFSECKVRCTSYLCKLFLKFLGHISG